ncbi:hypothetical protein P43SY_004850 [Pythium insidiosum]|uniref:HTH CENPB-type domain-containing protein n=1 Tax=Pythium insidiosum TaxID=114742 RepID=A0AAD5Q5B7_PYTIN|nr:hypothetical protein P43SY_004850 [Pythium insidiosum]
MFKQVRPHMPTEFQDDEAEQWLYDWVVGMQCIGIPCEPQDVIAKANAILAKLDAPPVGTGWYKRFLERHPLLVMRQAQVVSRVRNEVDVGVVTRLFWTVAKIVVEQKLDPSRVFNVDETAFLTRKKSRRVLAVKGSPNVWCKSITTNFHLSLVACASAAGFVVPPLFVLPGERVNRTLLDECSIPDATVTTTTSGFVSTALFASWLTWFAENVQETILVLPPAAPKASKARKTVDVEGRLLTKELLHVENAQPKRK